VELSEHLFRREAGRLIAAMTRVFGVHNLALAEDVVQDAFCSALETWSFRGVPDNPGAWLMAAAKHRALDVLRRERTARTHAPEIGRLLESEWTLATVVEELLTGNAIKDDLLRMMFSCCDPRLTEDAQIALILQILCGFSVAEVASAFVITHAAAEKRITRAKTVLATSKKLFDVADPAEFTARLPAVHRALYLLFNEGYHGASEKWPVRTELCREAMRLAAALIEHPRGRTQRTYALAALMALDAARLPARINPSGELTPLAEQDRSIWDRTLIAEGLAFLALSAPSAQPCEYHIEAAIASIHTCSLSADETDWESIVSLYDALFRLRPSPIVALNRAIAIAQHEGPVRGLDEIRLIEDCDRLAAYPFYSAAIGDLEQRCGRRAAARQHFKAAGSLARNAMERRFLERRERDCDGEDPANSAGPCVTRPAPAR
jgi:RNA polymerase sigma factor (sigma-70 family)